MSTKRKELNTNEFDFIKQLDKSKNIAYRIIDKNKIIIRCNTYYKKLNNKKVVIGKKCNLFLCAHFCNNKKCLADKVFKTKNEVESAFDVNLNKDLKSFITNILPLHDKKKNQFYVIQTFRDISIYRKTEQKLIESEVKYKMLFNKMTVGFALHEMIYDNKGKPKDYRFLDINPAFQKLTGLKIDIINKTAIQVIPNIEKHWIITYGNVSKTGKPIKFENYNAAIGKYFEVYAFSPRKDQFAVFILDITKSKQTEAKIEINNQRLVSLLRISQFKAKTAQQLLDYALNEAILLSSSQVGYIYYYNEKTNLFKLNTWSKEVMKECQIANPNTMYNLSNTGCWGEVVRQRKPIIINNYSIQHPLTKGVPKGHVMLKNFMSIPVFVDDEIIAVVGVANKHTDYEESDVFQLSLLMDSVWKILQNFKAKEELIEAKEKALENEKRIRTIFSSAKIGIVIINPEGKLIEWNNTFRNFFKYTNEELSNLSSSDLTYKEDSDISYIKIKQLVNKEISNFNIEKRFIRKDKSVFWVDLFASPMIKDDKIVALIGVVLDISERKQIETKIFNAIVKTEEKERKQFAEDLHDELGPFLSGIKLYINEFKYDDRPKEEKIKLVTYLNQIVDEAILKTRTISNQLMPSVLSDYGFIKALLSFSEKINETKVVSIRIFSEIAEKRYNQVLEIVLYRIIIELINNTIKHSSAKNVLISIKEKDNFMEVLYNDDGMGFDFEDFINKKSGIGLRSILNRLKSVNGTYVIDKKNVIKGFSIVFRIELTNLY